MAATVSLVYIHTIIGLDHLNMQHRDKFELSVQLKLVLSIKEEEVSV